MEGGKSSDHRRRVENKEEVDSSWVSMTTGTAPDIRVSLKTGDPVEPAVLLRFHDS